MSIDEILADRAACGAFRTCGEKIFREPDFRYGFVSIWHLRYDRTAVGLPPVAVKDWPRPSDGFALYHLVTLNLEEAARVAAKSPLPKISSPLVEGEQETGGVHVIHITDLKPAPNSGPLPDVCERPEAGNMWVNVW